MFLILTITAPFDFESTCLLGLFDIFLTSNTCPVIAATYLETVSYIGERLLIDIYKSPAYGRDPYINTPSARYVSAISEDVDEAWTEAVQLFSLQRNRPGFMVLDPLLKALARLKVIVGLLKNKHTTELSGDRVFEELCEGGEVALTVGLQTVNNILNIIPSLKVAHLARYVGILGKACGSDSNALTMETWTKMLASEAMSVSSNDSVTKLGRQPWCAYGRYVEVMGGEDPVVQNAALKLRGALMAFEYRLDDPSDPLFACDMDVWCRMLKVAGDECSVSCLRSLNLASKLI